MIEATPATTAERPAGVRRAHPVRCRSVLVGIVLVGAAGCSNGWQVHNVTDVGKAVSLDISSCNASYDVAAEETTDRVNLTVKQVGAGESTAECADELRVELEEPLGERVVVVNGEQREVREPSDP